VFFANNNILSECAAGESPYWHGSGAPGAAIWGGRMYHAAGQGISSWGGNPPGACASVCRAGIFLSSV